MQAPHLAQIEEGLSLHGVRRLRSTFRWTSSRTLLACIVTLLVASPLPSSLDHAVGIAPLSAQTPSPVTLPLSYVDTSYTLPTGCTTIPVGTLPSGGCKIITVNAGQNFQTALNQARRGDIIQLQANATWVGPYELPDKGAGTGWVYVVSSALGSLPGPGNRLNPDLGGPCGAEGSLPCGVTPNASLSSLPKIMSGGGIPYMWLATAHGADRYRFIGIEFGTTPGEAMSVGIRLYETVLGQYHSTLAQKTSDIIFDRCLMRGSYTAPYVGRAIAINGERHAVINSYLSGWVDDDSDTQAVLVSAYSPVFAIINNYLEASGENVFTDHVEVVDGVLYAPSDGEIRGNLLRKLAEWNSRPWNNTKNQFEMKTGHRMLFEGNIIDTTYHLAQETAINIKIGDEDARNFVGNVTVRKNLIRNVANGIKMCASQCNSSLNPNIAPGLAVYNNIFENVTNAFGDGGDGNGFKHIVTGPGVYVDHNTFLTSNEGIYLFLRGGNVGGSETLYITNNIWRFTANPLTGAEVAAVSSAAVYTNNLIVGGSCASYPAGNRCPASWAAVGFNNYNNGNGGDYTLSAASPYKGVGSDPFGVGTTDPGANVAQVNAATGCAFNGQCAEGSPAGDVTPPNVSITAPGNGATVSGSITLSANASDNDGVAGVQFLVDGHAVGGEDTNSPYTITWSSGTVPNGSSTITARARDTAGNFGYASIAVTVQNAGGADGTPPAVSITAPGSGATVSGTITVSASASDNVGVAGVQFLLDGANLGSEDTTSPFSVSWNSTSASNGTHTLTARARDAAGNVTTSASATVSVQNQTSTGGDTSPPSVSITSPANGSTLTGNVTVAATASDNVGIVGVQFLVDGLNLGPELTTAPYTMLWNTAGTPAGPHLLTAVARDAAGNSRTATAVSVTVQNFGASTDTTPPSVLLTSPTNGATVSGSVVLSADAADNVGVASVQFVIDGANYGLPVIAPPYSRSWDASTATAGSHVLSAIARDAAGNTRSAVAVTVNVKSSTSGAAPRGDVQRVSWTSLVNAKIYLWKLRKTEGCDNCADAGAISSQRVLSGDGYFEIEGTTSPKVYYVGWGPNSPGTALEDLEFALRLNGRSADVYEAGSPRLSQPYNDGDLLRISVTGGVVTYLRNGTPFYTSNRAPVYPMSVRAVLMDRRAEVSRASFWRAGAALAAPASAVAGGSGGGSSGASPRSPVRSGSGTPAVPRSPRTERADVRPQSQPVVVDADRLSAGLPVETWALGLLATTGAEVKAIYLYGYVGGNSTDEPIFLGAVTRASDDAAAGEWDTAQRKKIQKAVAELTAGSYQVTAFAQIATGAPYEIGILSLVIR